MTEQPIRLRYENSIAVLTLDRPNEANAIDQAFVTALAAVTAQIRADATARVIVLRAEGRMFSGGGNVRSFSAALEQGSEAASRFMAGLVDGLHEAILGLLALQMPIVAAVQGVAAGAGMSLVLAADVAYVTQNARLVPAYAGIGLSGDGGITWLLPRLVGYRKATELMLFNTMLDAQQAASLGLVNEVLPETGEAFDAAVMERARLLSDGPADAIGAIRALLAGSETASLGEQLAAESRAMTRLASGPEFSEGLKALAEKRKPVFSRSRAGRSTSIREDGPAAA